LQERVGRTGTVAAPGHQWPLPGIRHFQIEGVGHVMLEHTTLTIDEERHLRLVYYAVKSGTPQSHAFEQWLQQEPVLA